MISVSPTSGQLKSREVGDDAVKFTNGAPSTARVKRAGALPINLRAAREIADRRAIHQALTRTEHNISGAAKLLGISRPTLYDLIKQYSLVS